MSDLEAEWNTDAFLVSDEFLSHACRTTSGRYQKWAHEAGQEHDVTARGLSDLYRRQRGRCALTGYPLTKRHKQHGRPSTKNTPFDMELEHIVPRSEGGPIGMIANMRWACSLAHRIRHAIEDSGVDEAECFRRLLRVSTSGAAVNNSVEVFKKGDNEDTTQIIGDMIRSGECPADATEIATALLARSMVVDKLEIYQCLRNLGIDPQAFRANRRHGLIRRMLQADDAASRISTGALPVSHFYSQWVSSAKEEGIERVSLRQFRADMGVVMESIGVQFQKISKNGCASTLGRRFPNKPGNQLAVYAKLVSVGNVGVTPAEMASIMFAFDGCDVSACDVADVGAVLSSLVTKRFADMRDGVYTARLKMGLAAEYCGLSLWALQKSHRKWNGPASEVGHGSYVTFAYADLDAWLSQREQRHGHAVLEQLCNVVA